MSHPSTPAMPLAMPTEPVAANLGYPGSSSYLPTHMPPVIPLVYAPWGARPLTPLRTGTTPPTPILARPLASLVRAPVEPVAAELWPQPVEPVATITEEVSPVPSYISTINGVFA